MNDPLSLVRPLVRELHPYIPGEQPKIKGLIKLNTNENPYPPSPKVLQAVRAAVGGRLRLFSKPTAPTPPRKPPKVSRGKTAENNRRHRSRGMLAAANPAVFCA